MADKKTDDKNNASKRYEDFESKWFNYSESDHEDDILDSIMDAYKSGTTVKDDKTGKMVRKRKLTEDQAAATANKIYDAIGNYIIPEHFEGDPNQYRKQKHKITGESMHDWAVKSAISLQRTQLEKAFRRRAESGEKFTKEWMEKTISPYVSKYNEDLEGTIMGSLDVNDLPHMKNRIKEFVDKYKLGDTKQKKLYENAIKSNDFSEVAGMYRNLVAQYLKKK